MPPAARIFDQVLHPLPGVLTPGPGSFNVLIGFKPAWRAIPTAAAAAVSAAKSASDAVITSLESATVAAAGTPGAPAALAAELSGKAAAISAMSSMFNAAGGGADIHVCTTPAPPPTHGPGVVIDGSPTVLINNLPASRMGDTVLEALGPPDKIIMGEFTVLIGNGSAPSPGGGLGGLIGSIVSVVVSMLQPDYPRTVIMDDGTVATEYSKNVFVTGTNAEQAEKIRQLNAIRAGDGGEEFLAGLAKRDKPVIVTILGDPARGRELHPGQQSHENCAPQSAQQIINQATGNNHDEATMEGVANHPNDSGYDPASGTPASGMETQLENGGVPAHMAPGTTDTVDDALANGQGVISAHDAGELWNDPNYAGGGHAVHTTGAIQDQNGDTLGYTINDTGSDQNGRVLTKDEYNDSILSGVPFAVTDDPIW